MTLPCDTCKYKTVTIDGHRHFVGCKDEEKKKGFHYDDFFYDHTCDNYEREWASKNDR